MRPIRVRLLTPLTLAGVLALGAACNQPTPGAAGKAPESTPGPTGSAPAPPATTSKAPPKPPPTGTGNQSTSTWPSPEDCVSYNPNALTVHYEAGIHSVNEGTKVVARLPGGPGENVGAKGLALAQRYRKHCFLGRNNTREEKNSYIFDYWRDLSGKTPTIADQEDDCSEYDRTNLTVEDMGSGHGWRVKDHDHVLHLFDTETDARNGKLVLAKYSRICFLGNSGDDDPALVSYSL